MSMEGWTLFFTILGAIGGTIAAGAAIYSVVLTNRGLRSQGEQLRLQKDQAAMIPTLEVSDVRFLRPQDAEDVRATVREMAKKKQEDQQAKAEAEWYEQKSAEWEEAQRQKFYSSRSSINPYMKPNRDIAEMSLASSDPARFERRHYSGPMPHAVLDLEITNSGKTAAENISGTLQLGASRLRPIDFPDMDDRGISGPHEGYYRVQLARVGELLPDHKVAYRIALEGHSSNNDKSVHIKYEFVTPAGISLEDEKILELVTSWPREQ